MTGFTPATVTYSPTIGETSVGTGGAKSNVIGAGTPGQSGIMVVFENAEA